MRGSYVRRCEKRLAAMPFGQAEESISAGQKDEGSLRAANLWPPPAFECGYRVTCLADCSFGAIDGKARVVGSCQTHHGQALRGADPWRAAQGRLASGNPAHSGELQPLTGLLGESQMTEMKRVEGATEDAERPAIIRFRHRCR